MRSNEIEAALAAWREAARRLSNAVDGDREALEGEVTRTRDLFHRLSAEYMVERIDAMKEAESRRHAAIPSTDEFHAAARDEMAIAADIWDSVRMSDQETPRRTDGDGSTVAYGPRIRVGARDKPPLIGD